MSQLNSIESEPYSPVLSPEIKMALHKEHEAMQQIIKKEIEEGIVEAFKANTRRIESLECDLNQIREDFKRLNQLQQTKRTIQLSMDEPPDRHCGRNTVGCLPKSSILIILVLLIATLVFFIWTKSFTQKSSHSVVNVNTPQESPRHHAPPVEVETETENNEQIVSSPEPAPILGGGSQNSTKPVDTAKEDERAQVVNLKGDHKTYVAALDYIIKTETAPERSKLKVLIQKLYTAEGLEGTRHSVSNAQKIRFEGFVKQPSNWDTYSIKIGLFEYIAAISCSNCGKKIEVNLALGDITKPILTILNQNLPNNVRFSSLPAVNANNGRFQEFMAAVVLAQLKKVEL